jgi:hypothetical protein
MLQPDIRCGFSIALTLNDDCKIGGLQSLLQNFCQLLFVEPNGIAFHAAGRLRLFNQ